MVNIKLSLENNKSDIMDTFNNLAGAPKLLPYTLTTAPNMSS